jgi:hypothetical protein
LACVKFVTVVAEQGIHSHTQAAGGVIRDQFDLVEAIRDRRTAPVERIAAVAHSLGLQSAPVRVSNRY